MANSNGWGDGSVNNNIGWGQGANNTIGWGKSQLTSWSGATDIDGGNLPSNSVAPAITGTAQEGQTLTCSTGTWSGSPTYTYQWKRNGNNITSATNSTYTLVTADVGQTILCTVTATNFIGSASANSNSVTPTSSTDADAQAFITAASITDPTQQTAINNLVVGLKTDGIWTKMKALYPFVGGTASSHKFNLRNPLDTDAAFRLVFSGGITHSSTGVLFGGVNGYADTKLNPRANLTLNTTHTALYSRTNSAIAKIDMGCEVSSSSKYVSHIKWSDNNGYYDNYNDSTNRITYSMASTDSTGLFINNRTSNVLHNVWRNSTKLATNTTTQPNLLPNQILFIGALNSTAQGISFYSSREYAFASIGDGLTDTEAANFYTRVQAFNTTLNRQV